MSDGEDDILFRIGFESHPQAGSKLESLAQAVEMTQKRIDQMFTTTADRVAKAAASMTSSLANTGGKSTESPEAAMRAQLKATAVIFTEQTNRLVALQTDMVNKLEAIRAKDVQSADGHAKRLEAIYAGTLANLNAAVAAAQAGTGRVQVAVGIGGGATGGGPDAAATAAMQSGATQLEAMAAARQATHAKILANTSEFNTALGLAKDHEVLTLEERNEAAALFARSRQAIMRGEVEMHKLTVQHEQEQSRLAIEQLKKDIQLIEDIQNGGGGSVIGATEEEAYAAAERVKNYYETVKHGQDQVAAAEAKLIEQQIKEGKKLQAEQDRANRNRRKLIEGSRRQEEQANKQAEAEAAREDKARDAAINRRRKLIENSKKYERQLARETAEEAIRGYEQQEVAAVRAARMAQQGQRMLHTSMNQTATGLGKLARGMVLVGLAQGEEMEKVLRQLAVVQSAIDLVRGASMVARGVSSAFEGVRMVLMGKIAAQRASNAADALAVQGSTAVQNALNLEAMSANRAAAAHVMLARARAGGQAVQMPIVAQPTGTTVAGGRRAFVGGAVGGVGGAIVGGAAGSAVGSKVGGENGQAIGGTAGAVVGSVAGTVLIQQLMQHGPAIGKVIGRGVMMLAGAPVAKIAAVVAGTAFIARQTYTLASDVKQHGFMGGSEVGSFNDRVGGSKYNPASMFIAWNQRAELAQAEERTKRMEHASILLKLEQEHLGNLQKIRLDFESKKRSIEQKTEDAIFEDQLSAAKTTSQKLELVRGRSSQRADEREQAAQGLMGFIEEDANGKLRVADTNEAKDALDKYISANNRLIESEKKREQLARQIAAENRKNVLEEIKGIEDVINSRRKEMEAADRQYMTAKERFGAMNELDQAMALRALEKARTSGVESLSRVELQRVESVGTDESKEMVSQARIRSAERAGFDDVNRPELDRRQAAQQQAMDMDIDRLATTSGQSRDEIAERAKQPAQIELVDRTQFEITLNKQDEVLFNAILEEIRLMREQDGAAMIERLQQERDRQTDAENQQARQAREQVK